MADKPQASSPPPPQASADPKAIVELRLVNNAGGKDANGHVNKRKG
jgi:hypothetical protein